MDRTGENEKDNGEPQLHDTSVAVPVLVIGGLFTLLRQSDGR